MNGLELIYKYPWVLQLLADDEFSQLSATIDSVLSGNPALWHVLPEELKGRYLQIGVETGQIVLRPNLLSEQLSLAVMRHHPLLITQLPPIYQTRDAWLLAVAGKPSLWADFPPELIRTIDEVQSKLMYHPSDQWVPHLPKEVLLDAGVFLCLTRRYASVVAEALPFSAWDRDRLVLVSRERPSVLPCLPAEVRAVYGYADWMAAVEANPAAFTVVPAQFRTLEMCRTSNPGSTAPPVFQEGRMELVIGPEASKS